MPRLLAKAGGKGEVVAADCDSGGLNNLKKMHAEQIDPSRLSVADLLLPALYPCDAGLDPQLILEAPAAPGKGTFARCAPLS